MLYEVITTSASPSPSTSTANTDWASSASVEMVCGDAKIPNSTVFGNVSYHRIASSNSDALIHGIHGRVLEHIRTLSETPPPELARSGASS